MPRLPDLELSSLRPEELPLAAALAARGMCDNRSSLALFGDDPARRLRNLAPVFHRVLASMRRPVLVARRRQSLVGIAALAPVDQCFSRQLLARDRVIQIGQRRLGLSVPSVPRSLLLPLARGGPVALGRLFTWGEAGLKHDSVEPHQIQTPSWFPLCWSEMR